MNERMAGFRRFDLPLTSLAQPSVFSPKNGRIVELTLNVGELTQLVTEWVGGGGGSWTPETVQNR